MPSAATFSAGLSSNYTITYANGTLTVNPAALTITANNASKTYGQTAIVRRHRVHDQRPGQRRHGRQRDRDQHRARRPTAAVGTYPIVPSAATFSAGLSSNYTITYANGTLTVNPARADDHGQQREQDLRPDGDRSPAPRSRPAAWSTATRSAA